MSYVVGVSVASLPWYDFAELRPHTDAWWGGISRHLGAAGVEDVPDKLDRGDYVAHWRRPVLLLSQSCGYDLTGNVSGVYPECGTEP